ncbi:MAG: PEP/pyruvate-binding domain-containing protein [Scrofimicrobium sp.]
MSAFRPISTGHPGIDGVVDGLRLGDNVVWQADDIEAYEARVAPFVQKALADGHTVVYFRFGGHRPVVHDERVQVFRFDPSAGFESLARSIYQTIADIGVGAYYVFDSLTELLAHWNSDLMVMNFFKVTCPYLFQLDTVAYFCLLRGRHSFDAIAGIRETTQLLLDLHTIKGADYVQVHKAWGRYSPTMFFPHLLRGDEAIPVTSSAQAVELFGKIGLHEPPLGPWPALLLRANQALATGDATAQEEVAKELRRIMIGHAGRMGELAEKHLALPDLLAIAGRRIGSGRIGGKSVGMLVATQIALDDPELGPRLEPQDSFYLGSDLFFTYLIENGWWADWVEQKSSEGYFPVGARLHENLRHGTFGPAIRERFLRVLEHFGQSPIIVRSSSLLEDNFGNAFSGKYESVFCANQGTPEHRLRALEDAVRVVYSSAMGTEPLHYRLRRNLADSDEQMAILVQRVSGAHHGDYFFPNAAGVGNSHNLFVFSEDINPEAGALRLVVGLGTRAVDRLENDYARMVPLDNPTRSAVDAADLPRYSQQMIDVIDLPRNELVTVPIRELQDLDAHWDLFVGVDRAQVARARERGRPLKSAPKFVDHAKLLGGEFPSYMRNLLRKLADTYDYPVDIEFTVNIDDADNFHVGLVQCRPLQTRGVGTAVKVPELEAGQCLFTSRGGFMGGNLDMAVDRVVYVDPQAYLALPEQERYEVARTIGRLNRDLSDQSALALAPGRWGSRITSLGVPVSFAEINHMNAIVEFTDPALDFNVDLSFGSHFFQDLVETGIFFVALDQMNPESRLNPEFVLDLPNQLDGPLSDVIHVAETPGLRIWADVVSQQLKCAFETQLGL